MHFCSLQDTISNSMRVIKTYRQTNAEVISYPNAVKQIIEKDGIGGLLWRGLKTRIVANGLQGILFSVMWKLLEDEWIKKSATPSSH